MAQLKTGIWIDALIRRAEVAGAFGCLVHKGDRDSGTVLVVVRSQQGLTLYAPERDMQGDRLWRPEEVDQTELSRLIMSRLKFDSDLNVVEIEDRAGRHFIEEQVLMTSSPDAVASEAAAQALFQGR